MNADFYVTDAACKTNQSQIDPNFYSVDTESIIDWSGMSFNYHLMEGASHSAKNLAFQTERQRLCQWRARPISSTYETQTARQLQLDSQNMLWLYGATDYRAGYPYVRVYFKKH